ncbi:hypothetical protein KIL84_004952 [Mauremys mutica]|uniref:Uncharacterized protein n=1 Tax=Mauremys mutica TaxID=74926 RepID=A0A9D3WPI6_9SAUR|nr:hypothetical protein KIL84_004952 [Mauremys mutica]
MRRSGGGAERDQLLDERRVAAPLPDEEEEEEGAMQPKLGELSTSDVTKDSVHLSWTVQAGAFDSFLLQYRDTEGKRQALPVDGGSRTLD